MSPWLRNVLTVCAYVVGAKALLIVVFLGVRPLMLWVQGSGALGLWFAHAAALALVVLGHHVIQPRRPVVVGIVFAATTITGLATIIDHWAAAAKAIDALGLAGADAGEVVALQHQHAMQGGTALVVVLGIAAALFVVGRRRAQP